MPTILWFKRDLRVQDNAALLRAYEMGDPIPVYIVEPALWAQRDVSGRQYAFLVETVEALRTDLRALGSDLVVRVGDAVAALDRLRIETGAARLISHQETGNDWTYARDRAVAAWARGQGVEWQEMPMSAVRRGRHDRDGWAAHRNGIVARDPLPAPKALPRVDPVSDPLPDADWLRLAPDLCTGRQTGGRKAAEQTLDSFLAVRGRTYRKDMSSPLTGETACSRLSPYLALGTLTVRETVQVTVTRQAMHSAKGQGNAPRGGWNDSLKSFQSRLAWRDHFIQKLEDEPELEWRVLHSAYDGLRPNEPDTTRLAAWEKGETGLPFVDACMRSLNATGWLNFRMRAMLMSVASYHLWLPWQSTGQHLARVFTDYEPGIHWSQVQMQSGTTGINTPRIYNPVKQGQDQDPTGAFTRRWCPELAVVPDGLLQEPWKWTGQLTYPAPIVDVPTVARAARDAIWAVRRNAGFAHEAGRVICKHASRKDPQRHFVNDRTARRRAPKTDDRQSSFNF